LDRGDSGVSSQEPPESEKLPPIVGGPNAEKPVYDPSGKTPEEIFAPAKDHVSTPGAPSSIKGLHYTQASRDGLHERLVAKVARARAVDRAFARRIGMTSFEVNRANNQAWIAINLRNAEGRLSRFVLSGRFDLRSKTAEMGSFAAAPGIKARAVCVDADGNCRAVVIELRKEMEGIVALAHVIARQTTAYLYIGGNAPGASMNPEYDRLMNLFLNTVYWPGQAGGLSGLSFFTSEVIGAASDFAIVMRMRVAGAGPGMAEQSLSLSGPLLMSAKGGVDLNLRLARPVAYVGGHPSQREPALATHLVESIREVRLVKNDGRGDIQLDLIVRAATPGSQEDTVQLTVARIERAIRTGGQTREANSVVSRTSVKH
jgi:hypothetical protein